MTIKTRKQFDLTFLIYKLEKLRTTSTKNRHRDYAAS
jgi:hypothetical protein